MNSPEIRQCLKSVTYGGDRRHGEWNYEAVVEKSSKDLLQLVQRAVVSTRYKLVVMIITVTLTLILIFIALCG